MSEEPKKSDEFRRYRQSLTGLYLAAAACCFILLVTSVVVQLSSNVQSTPSDTPISLAKPAPSQLLHCYQKVDQLYQDLGTTAAGLLVPPATGKSQQIGAKWQEFSLKWKLRWQQAERLCRFSDARQIHRGVAYGRLARVHHDLPTMHLKYQSILVQFDNHQAAELMRMRRALDRSQTALNKAANREVR